MAEEQDKGNRLVFSFPRMVEDLIRRFVGGRWIERLDFNTLEKVSERDLSPELVRREKDLLWRLRIRSKKGKPGNGDWFYVYLHLEFQSQVYRFMAIRVLTYRALLWEDLIRQKAFTSSGRLPPVLSVVLYNGERPWNAPTSVKKLIEPLDDAPEGTDPLSYLLIKEQSYPLSELDSEASPVAGLFAFEQIRDPGELIRESRKAGRGLPGAENQPLREALGAYVMQRLRKLAPNLRLSWKTDLLEVPSMLEQRVVEWTQQWKQEGRKEGEVAVLLRQLSRRFGPLDRQVEERVQNADAKQILEWADRFVTACTLEEVFDGEGHD